jgi:DNA-binding SARP family transcriptional activator
VTFVINLPFAGNLLEGNKVKLEIKLFGRLQVTDSIGAVMPPLRQRAERLLVYLLLHRRAPQRREQAAFTLWPDTSEEEALATLRRALSDLRAVLPAWVDGDWLLVSPREIRWNPSSPYQLDVDEFERLARQAAPQSLRAAAALYTGDLLPELDDDWVLAERERLRLVQAEILQRLIAHHRAMREYNLAIDYAQAALALDPLAEAVHRELIAIRYETGDRAGALAAYERFRAEVWDELGVEPMPETQALAQAIARGERLTPAQPARSGPAPAPAAVPGEAPIGREREIEQLAGWWEAAGQGRGSLVILSGEAGVGKSDLVRWLENSAAQSGGLVLTGQCYQFERTLPYQPIVEMLRAAVGPLQHTALLPAYRALLARLVPEILETAGPPGGEADLLTGDLRPQLYEAMLQAFLALARDQPLLLAFEHIHWAAESTLDWLIYCAPRLPGSRMLVLVTCRTSEIGADHALKRLEQRFSREGAVQSLRLLPFGREITHGWVARESHLSGPGLDRVADCLFRETGGHLFFLQELVRGLKETGQIVLVDRAWSGRFVEDAPCADAFVPETLRSAILARVARLPDLPRKFLKTAAVAGGPFYYDVVRQAEHWTDDQALDALDETLQRGFIQEDDLPGRYGFVHHLVEEAVYANMSPPRRVYRHREVAMAIQALHPGEYEALADHFERAGEDEPARRHHLRAAERALELGALTDAAAHFTSALRRWPEDDPEGRAEVAARLEACAVPHAVE